LISVDQLLDILYVWKIANASFPSQASQQEAPDCKMDSFGSTASAILQLTRDQQRYFYLLDENITSE
jgi:hypothetical protein